MKITETLFKSEGSNNRGLLNGIKGGDKMAAGRKEFDFRITLPSEVVVDKSKWHDLKVNQSVRLPPTLSSKAWSWAFYYEISVQVKRSGLLAMDDKWVQVAKYGLWKSLMRWFGQLKAGHWVYAVGERADAASSAAAGVPRWLAYTRTDCGPGWLEDVPSRRN